MKRYFIYAPANELIEANNSHPIFTKVGRSWKGVWACPKYPQEADEVYDPISTFAQRRYLEVSEEVHRFVTNVIFARNSDVYQTGLALREDPIFKAVLAGGSIPERYVRPIPPTKHKLGVPKGVLP